MSSASAQPDETSKGMPPPAWLEVRVLCPAGWEELVAEVLSVPPCTAVVFGQAEGDTPAPPAHTWIRTFIGAGDDAPELRERLLSTLGRLAERTSEPELALLSLEFRALPPVDYANSWKLSWKPFRIGRLCVVPPWRETKLRAHDIRLLLEPGGAFGSGRHATTRMCLRSLQERLRGGELVLDAGSGSGILAVAACLLGARAAIGFDDDRHAQPAAEKLACDNGVASRARFITTGFELLVTEPGPYDVIMANIYADVLAAQALHMSHHLAPGGWFAFSGCSRERLSSVCAAVEQAGLAIAEIQARGRWRTILGGPRVTR